MDGQDGEGQKTEEQVDAPEESQFELRPCTQIPTPLVTLQTIYELLLKERATQMRLERMLSNKRDTRISLQKILI